MEIGKRKALTDKWKNNVTSKFKLAHYGFCKEVLKKVYII